MEKSIYPMSIIVSSLYEVGPQLGTLQRQLDSTRDKQSDMVAIERVAKRILLKQLRSRAPEIPIYTGGSHAVFSRYRQKKLFFVVSPLDGSRNWVDNLPMWGVSVASVDDQKITCGATFSGEFRLFRVTIDDPAVYSLDLKRAGLYNVEAVHVSPQDQLSQALVALDWEVRDQEVGYHLVQVLSSRAKNTHLFGCGIYALTLVAKGAIDGFVHLNPHVQHIAASILLIKKSGGMVTDLAGNPYDLFSRQPIVATNGKIHGELLEKISGVGF